jgi:cytochrome c553
MRNKLLLIAVIVAISALFITAGIYAGTKVPDVIKMENKAYKKHKKSIMTFSHKKHVEEYKAGCGECHHDDKNKPLTNLKEGDEVQNCIECHKKPGETPGKTKKKWRAEKVSKADQRKMKLEWHAEAIHYNCKDCHKKFNKENKTKKAPTTCTKCHPKKS